MLYLAFLFRFFRTTCRAQSSPKDCVLDFVCSFALSLCMIEASWSLTACSFTRVQPASDQAFDLGPPPALPCSLHHKQNRVSTPSAVLSKVIHGRLFLHPQMHLENPLEKGSFSSYQTISAKVETWSSVLVESSARLTLMHGAASARLTLM